MWPETFRVYACAITYDGKRLIVTDTEEKIHVYDFHTHEEEYCLSLDGDATSIAVSHDSRYLLVGITGGQIQLIDIETSEVIRHFKSQKMSELSNYIIRSTFGGASETCVLSGSEGKHS